jgi:Zn-finger nucleic acid-binding protein
MQCTMCKVDLLSLGLSVLSVKMGHCPKCGLVHAQKVHATPVNKKS